MAFNYIEYHNNTFYFGNKIMNIIFKNLYLFNIVIIEIIKMSQITTKQMDLYLSLVNSQIKLHTVSDIKINVGKHFLSQIWKLKDENALKKIKWIEIRDDDKLKEEKIQKDIVFFKAKKENLFQRLWENKNEQENNLLNEMAFKIRAKIRSVSILTMQSKQLKSDFRLEKLDNELKVLKEKYNS